MATLLLIGPQAAGKTTFLNSAKNEKKQTSPTVKADDKFFRGIKIGGLFGAIIDTAGNTTAVLNNSSKLQLLLEKNNRIAFMFNGKDFLNEVTQPQKAGEITSIIKNLLLPIWNMTKNIDKQNKKQLFFIANYSTDREVNEFYIDVNRKGAKEQILQAMQEANLYYEKLAQCSRYPFINYFENNACFYCIDARNFTEVQNVGNIILK